ncbi:acylamino-acid-releasing enzyme [Callorhinchus milii]|uniref:Acylamino-acid-releasing enzyme n=1 Tax=Callorhinchus milii TaxID=7868 RepID=V9K946_CALMI|nr:acylamino-acid-releasing enzyme [Callorhinchus milii]|eukprot:gi/632946646/ref/XP_007888659.1/ PREDICTED: acylamino-acid-releasing enzyme [Callorhinchus milii]
MAAPGSEVLTDSEDIAGIYRELSRFPFLAKACIGPEVISQYGGKYCNIHTEWTQRDLERVERVNFCRQYIIFYDENSIVYTGPSGNCTELQSELLSRESPSGSLRAVLREHTNKKGEEKQFLEIWNRNSKEKSIDLTSLDKHGKVYEDGQFGCLVWSHSESHILYIAEKKRPKTESFFQSKSELRVNDEDEDCVKQTAERREKPLKGDQFVYWEDWGEALVNKSIPVLCVLDIESNNISVLEGIPEHTSPGQAFWAPNDTGIVFVGWGHETQRLGLVFCTNRKSGLYYVDLTSGNCVGLTSQANAVVSPRLSPDKCRIVYLEREAGGPHHQCCRLRMYDWYTKITSTVVDIVNRPTEDGFTGIYSGSLAQNCWTMNSQRLLIDTQQNSRKDLFVIDIATGSITSLTSSSEIGSWTLLDIQRDIMVVSCSAPNCPPCLKVGILPAAGSEQEVTWVALDEAERLPDIEWQILTFTPPCGQEHPKFPAMDFEVVLLTPEKGKEGSLPPLVVSPHGGPHSVFTAEWMLYPIALCKLGFAVLLVNYRGSSGFGQDNIYSLLGRIGSQDVKDVQYSVEQVLKMKLADPSKVFVTGGSHGGFLASHLVGQYPNFYKACATLNPVINIVSMLATTDIPDWCTVEAGFNYTVGQIPTPPILEAMLKKSPISHASQIKTPLLILLGEKDKRVPPSQGLELYRTVKARGGVVRLLWYPENNHHISKVDAEADVFMNIALWFVNRL